MGEDSVRVDLVEPVSVLVDLGSKEGDEDDGLGRDGNKREEDRTTVARLVK